MQASSLPRRLLGLSRKARRRARHGLLLSCHTDLEARALLSAVPAWIEQGPAPINGSERIDVPFGITTGAIQSVAINPGNPAQIYVATVNGGVWRTDNANGQNPAATRWTPLTDQLPSLAMGDLAFSPLDASHKTLFAGTGSFSSGGPATDNAGGPPIGVLRTTDGGANWTVHPLNPGGAEFRVKALLPTSIRVRTPGGDQPMVLAGTVLGGGLYRSDDNGETYSLLSGHDGLPRGDVTSLIVDPNDPNRFYAGIAATSSSRGG
ncbi:MAG: hypothetical protein U0790_23435, partial [Isosphaeraceae bacterium]